MRRVSILIGTRAGLPGLPASDRAAIALAVRRLGGEVHAFCRRGDEEAERYALAAGAAGVTPIDDAGAVDFDVLLVGEGGAGESSDLLLAQLAERKGCALVLEVLDVQEESGALVITRDLGRGAREVLSVEGPAVLGVSVQSPRLHYVSRYRRQAAAVPRGAARLSAASDSGPALSPPWEPARPRPRTGDLTRRTRLPASERMQALMGISAAGAGRSERAHVIVADAETCARHLLRYLAHHGFIDRRPAQDPAQPEISGRGAEPRPGPDLTGGGKLSRGPRPAGQREPSRIRGPFGSSRHA